MVNLTRLYIEVNENVPPQHRPPITVPIIDCARDEASALKQRLQRRGYTVHAVPL
jgi:hypothetical protein